MPVIPDSLSKSTMKVSQLVPYVGNAKEHPDWQVDQIAASIEAFGFNDPIAVWQDIAGHWIIVEGHGRLLAAKQLGMKEVPVIRLDHLDDEGRRAYTLAHNKLTMNTDFDLDILEDELHSIEGFDMTEFGFEEIAFNLVDFEGDVDDEPMPEEVETRCKEGDVWELGNHRVVCGDATSEEDLDRLMDGRTAQLYLTDPPYGVSYVGKTEDALTIENDDMDDEGLGDFLDASFSNAVRAMDPGAAFYVFHADSKGHVFRQALTDNGLPIRECLIWVKNTLVLGRQDYHWRHEPCLYGWKDGGSHHWYSDRRQTTVLEFDRPTANREHPTMKPVPLLAYLVRNSSQKGETVLDTFGGSGSTLLACEKLGRSCCMMELDPHYCDVILQRWEDLTGRKAVRL